MDELFYNAVDLLKSLIAVPSVSREENAAADVVQFGANRLRGRRGNDPLRGEHLHMRLAALDVVLVKPFVK